MPMLSLFCDMLNWCMNAMLDRLYLVLSETTRVGRLKIYARCLAVAEDTNDSQDRCARKDALVSRDSKVSTRPRHIRQLGAPLLVSAVKSDRDS